MIKRYTIQDCRSSSRGNGTSNGTKVALTHGLAHGLFHFWNNIHLCTIFPANDAKMFRQLCLRGVVSSFMNSWLALGFFLFGAAAGALLTAIFYAGQLRKVKGDLIGEKG